MSRSAENADRFCFISQNQYISMDIRLDASMEEALERVSIWKSETLAHLEETMTTETDTTTRTPDANRSDDGIGRPNTSSHSAIDTLGNPSRTQHDRGGPDCRHDPDFGYNGDSGSNRNSPLF